MKIISYNVNGIRAALKKGFADWLSENDFDIVCIQETKAQPEQVDISEIEALGYKAYWFSAQKKGYSGVAVFTKIDPINIIQGQNNEKSDFEGRTLQLEFKDFTLINTYFPSGSSGEIRQAFKYEFLDNYFDFIKSKQDKNIIVVGDYNICHEAIDIHNPKGLKNASGFLPEEREWVTQFIDSGFIDSFRYFNDGPDQYTWWTYRFGARGKNLGWRIDYHMVSKTLEDRLKRAVILSEAVHSDHCPLMVEID